MIRAAVTLAGVLSSLLSNFLQSPFLVIVTGAETAYLVVFPQLVCALFFNVSNGYGVIAGFCLGVCLRLLCGNPALNLPVLLRFPGCTLEDGVHVQLAPVKTICMMCSLAAILFFSFLFSELFNRALLPESWDVFQVKLKRFPPPSAPAEGAVKSAAELKDTSEALLS